METKKRSNVEDALFYNTYGFQNSKGGYLKTHISNDNKDGHKKIFTSALNELIQAKSEGKVFLNKGELHSYFYASKPGNNLIINNDTMVHAYNCQINGLDNNQKTFLEKNKTPLVSIGTQLVSGKNCFLSCYLTQRFLTKNNGAMINSLNNFIQSKLNKEKDLYNDSQIDQYDNDNERTKKWRKEGKFMARIAWPFVENGIIKWKDHKAIDLLEWEPVVDYIKDTQSLTFIKTFIERYRGRLNKEPVIGELKVPLKDYVDFFTVTEITKNQKPEQHSKAAYVITSIGLSRDGYGKADVNNFYNKKFDFNALLGKLIKANNLHINIQELNNILENKHRAKDAPTKMFVLVQESHELSKSIEEFIKNKNQMPNSNHYQCFQPNYNTSIQTPILANYNPYTANYYYPGTKKTKINYKKPHEINVNNSDKLFIGGYNYNNLPTWNACSLEDNLIQGDVDFGDQKYKDWIMYDVKNRMPGYQMNCTYPNNYYTYY